jgi:hypothetical protein
MSDDLDAADLDARLRRAMAQPRADDAAAERMVRRLEARTLPPQKRGFAWWPAALRDVDFAPAWPRVAALAAAAVLGVSIGLSSYGMRIAADLNLVRVASVDDTANNVFDFDLGYRP